MKVRILAIFLILLPGSRRHFRQALHHPDSTWASLGGGAERQYKRLVPLVSRRGTIFDRPGGAGSQPARLLRFGTTNRHRQSKGDGARPGAHLGPGRRRELQARLSADKTFVWLQRQLEPPPGRGDQRSRSQGHWPGSGSRRYYPRQDLASHVLGMVGLDDRGLEGSSICTTTFSGGSRNS